MKTAARKKIIQNAVMVVAILAILASGILTVGNLQGWICSDDSIVVTQPDGSIKTMEVLAQNKIGSANIQRGGVAYSLKDGNKLRNRDIIKTLNGSSIDIAFGENTISLNENSQATIHVSEAGEISMELKNGNVFASIFDPFTLRLAGTDVSLNSGVFSASAPYGSASIYVFENTLQVGDVTIDAGNAASILQDGIHTSTLSIQSLSSFDLVHITRANESRTLCFSGTQIEQLAAEREAAMQEATQARLLAEENAQKVEAQRQKNEENQIAKGSKSGNKTVGNNGGNTSGNNGGNAGDNGSEGDEEESNLPPAPTCTIAIRCDTILDNMADLTEGKNKYVPANGVILATSKLSFEEGETVFDVLKRACSLAGIQLEYSWTPMYNSHYIEGINHLYEFDCGPESGWMYKVNGWFPNYGASVYTLKDGDVIVWTYTCKGLGADVGGSVY